MSNPDEIAGTMTLRRVLYRYIKMTGGEPLFAEVHQNGPMGTVQVVVGKTPEAERLVLMINKQPAVFFSNYLKDRKVDPRFVDDLVRASIDATFLHSMHQCQ